MPTGLGNDSTQRARSSCSSSQSRVPKSAAGSARFLFLPGGLLTTFRATRRLAGVNVAGTTCRFDMLDEVFSPQIERSHLPHGNAAEREIRQSAIPQVLERQSGDGFVVATHVGKIEFRQSSAKIDGRKSRRKHRIRHPLVVDADENAIAIPSGKPLRRRHSQTLRFEVHRPRAVQSAVAGDAFNHPAPQCARRFNQHGNAKKASHENDVSGKRSLNAGCSLVEAASQNSYVFIRCVQTRVPTAGRS